MNNNKDFSEQLSDLFEELSLDQASNLIDNQIEPSKEELQEEVINNLRKNEVKIDRKILNELKETIKESGDVNTVMEMLRETTGLKYTDDALEELEVVEPEQELEVVEPELKKENYIESLSDRLSSVLSQHGMRSTAPKKQTFTESELNETLEARVDAIQSQLGLLRTSILESNGNTIVSGIGQGGDGQSPGSGETRLNRLDDVHIPLKPAGTRSVSPAGLSGESRYEIEDGSVLVWDSSIYPDGGWTVVPGDTIGGGGIIDDIEDIEPIFGKIWNGKVFNTSAPLYFGTYDDYKHDTDDTLDWNTEQVLGTKITSDDIVSFENIIAIEGEEIIDQNDSETGAYEARWYVIGAVDSLGNRQGIRSVGPNKLVSSDDAQYDDGNNSPILGDDGRSHDVIGVYFREHIDGQVLPDPEQPDIIAGHPTGCIETNAPAIMYWGEVEQYNAMVEGTDPNLTGADIVRDMGSPVIATQILSVYGERLDGTDLQSDIEWTIVYADDTGIVSSVKYTSEAKANQDPFEGPFLYASSAVCVAGGGGLTRVRTDEVYLAKLDDLTTTFTEINRLYGTIPIDLTEFTFQEEYNEFVADALLDLHKLKPTMLVAEYSPVDPQDESIPDYNVSGVHNLYVAIAGDLWFDPNDNTLRAAKNVSYVPASTPDATRPGFSAEWVLVSGDSDDSRVTTDQVDLINTIRLYEQYNEIFGDSVDWNNYLQLVTQEDLNIFNVELFRTLNEIKSTVHVGTTIHEKTIEVNNRNTGVPIILPYRPQRGDIWVDPTDYSMYICDYGTGNKPKLDVPPNGDYPYQDRDGNYLFWIEVGGSSAGGNRVFVQEMPPQDNEVVTGDLWVETSTYIVYVRSNDTWVALTGDPTLLNQDNRVHVGLHPKLENNRLGDLWFDTHSAEMRIWLQYEGNNGWYPVAPGGISPGFVQYAESTIRAQNEDIASLTARLNDLESYVASTSNYNSANDYQLNQVINSYDYIVDEATSPNQDDSNSGY